MWLFIFCFREMQKALQDCKALYPRLELSIAIACGAQFLKVRFFCISVHSYYNYQRYFFVSNHFYNVPIYFSFNLSNIKNKFGKCSGPKVSILDS